MPDNWSKHQGDGMAETKSLLGKRIRSLRRLGDLSQEQLAESARISVKYFSEIERGNANTTVDVLERISVALGIDLAGLFDFHHELSRGELEKAIRPLLKNASDIELQSVFRILKSMLR